MFHGLTRGNCRRVAFQYAKSDNKYPASWENNGMAGKDWFYGFLQRQETLAVRLPEATSLARAICFNNHNVQVFFHNFEVLQRFDSQPQYIWNIDETGISTVQKPKKVISEKGLKHV